MDVTDEMVDAFALACPAKGLRWREDIAAGLAAVLAIAEREAGPRRGDEVDAWIKRTRDQYEHDEHVYTGDMRWDALDDLLGDYRDHADTGVPLDRDVTGPHAHMDPVDSAPYSPGVDRG